MGLCRPDDILASLRAVDTVGSDGGSFFSGASDSFLGDFDDGEGLDALSDYFDSRGIQTSSSNNSGSSTRASKKGVAVNPFGWIGESPLPSTSKSTSPCSSPSTHYLTPHPMLQRRQIQAQYMVMASPMPTGSRAVNPPFIQVGPPPAPAPLPAAISASFSNSAASRSSSSAIPVGVSVGSSGASAYPKALGSGLLPGSSPSGLNSAASHYTPVSMATHAMLNSPLSSTSSIPRGTQAGITLGDADNMMSRLPAGGATGVKYEKAAESMPLRAVGSAAAASQSTAGSSVGAPSLATPESSTSVSHPDLVLNRNDTDSNKLDASTENDDESPMDDEIALLEAQLEIKRMEARLLALKKSKK